jgi:hypothetical protein
MVARILTSTDVLVSNTLPTCAPVDASHAALRLCQPHELGAGPLGLHRTGSLIRTSGPLYPGTLVTVPTSPVTALIRTCRDFWQ